MLRTEDFYCNFADKTKKLLVYIGSLLERKNLESLVPMLKRRADVCLAIVGAGPHREALEQAFYGTNVVFTGFLRGRNLAEAYASCDGFILFGLNAGKLSVFVR